MLLMGKKKKELERECITPIIYVQKLMVNI